MQKFCIEFRRPVKQVHLRDIMPKQPIVQSCKRAEILGSNPYV